MQYLLIGLGYVLLYAVAGLLLSSDPLALSLFGNISLVFTAALAPAIVLRRRRQWAGTQRLFWDTVAIGAVLWITGHFGWAYGQLIRQHPTWLEWHTVFSLCGGVAPLIALLARPHRGPRYDATASTAIDLAAYGLLGVFVYLYFVLIPAISFPDAGDGQAQLLYLVQINRLLLLVGMLLAAWMARGTAWRSTFVRLALGASLGFVLRLGTSTAIVRGEYQVGSVHDLAWIVPWLFFAWAAREAPASEPENQTVEVSQPPALAFSALPVLLIPAIGYAVVVFQPLGDPTDSFRALLTSMTTLCGLGLLILRLAAQGGTLQRADARLRLLAAATEQTGDLILITRADGRFEHANEAFLRALDYTRLEMASMQLELTDPSADGGRPDIPAIVRQQGIWRGTLRRRRKNGTTFPVSCTVVALRAPNGAITHFVGVERDITEELRLRDQLVQSERLSAIGELVAGVAHEINNPLQTIVGCVELMMDERATIERRDLELVRQEAARAGQIVRNLLSFVRRTSPDRALADLNQIVRATAALREYHLQQVNVTLVLECAEGALPVLVNRDEIQQVILNLLLNSEHAITSSTGQGTITIRTFRDGAGHVVEVADTGPGVRPELRGRIFEPFFTTKQVGEGTGLGLSISHGTASAHGGSLELRPSAAGACFRLTLPAQHEEAAAAAPTRPVATISGHALVVDDEAPIRKLMVRLLKRRGFDVIEAETSAAAATAITRQAFELIVCDVRMPGLNGFELYRQIAARHPQCADRFVFITGDNSSVEHTSAEFAHLPVLAKPFTGADLDALLARIGVGARVSAD